MSEYDWEQVLLWFRNKTFIREVGGVTHNIMAMEGGPVTDCQKEVI